MIIPIYIEKKKYLVEKTKNILEACLSLGFDIPYFCWHPALGSVGSCRQCAVKVYRYNHGKKIGQLVMACMTPVEQNIIISLFEKELKEFRKSILELLMINHPHDCPVCEEGGNCHLQDMTVMTEHVYRRYRFSKRTYYNQYLGPFINHEMNRCITCYRCVRYYRDYAGGNDLGVFGVHNNVYFGRVQDGKLESEFSGNLVEICPTGVFTDKTQSNNYSRKWDITFTPSICHQCSVGCNIILGERYGKLSRVENRYNSEINGYFLCDRGRFGCNYINLNNRLVTPLKKKDDDNNYYYPLDQEDAILYSVNLLKNSNKVIGIGSPRASLESNFALRNLVGSDNFYSGIDIAEQERIKLIFDILYYSDIAVPSICEIESYDLILILGEDLTQTGARIALSVRQAIQGKSYQVAESEGIFSWQSSAVINIAQNVKNPLLITSIDKTKLDDIAMFTYYASVQNQARFGFAIAHALDDTFPAITDNFDEELNKKLNIVVQILRESKKPLIISGSSSGSKELILAAYNIAQALKRKKSNVGITFVVQDVNSIGLSMMTNKSFEKVFDILCNKVNSSLSTSVIILENDLYHYSSVTKIDLMLSNIKHLIVLDHQHHLIQKRADLILPSSSFAESDGTVVNYEGRAQRFFKLYSPQYYNKNNIVLESWRWLYLIYDLYINHIRTKMLDIDYIIDCIVYCFPKLAGIKYAAPDSKFTVYGQKIAQSSQRYSGRTSMHSHINIHEPSVPINKETMFTFSMEGNHNEKLSHNQIALVWAPGWNSPQAWNKFQNEVGGSLCTKDPGILLLKKTSDNKQQCSWYQDIIFDELIIENRKNKWLIAPYWHLFGSEYTSRRSQCIKNCMFFPYAMLNLIDAKQLNIQKNMFLKFVCADQTLCLPIKLSEFLPIRHIGLPIGFPGIPKFFSGMYAKDVQGISL